jgi:hypothetical protein
MKIRIRGNSVRFRLTKKEVQAMKETGVFEERTVFGPNRVFRYVLEASEQVASLQAEFSNDCIKLIMPSSDAAGWYDSDQIGFENTIENGEEGGLFLLLEKDFVCIDNTFEDQSDNYPNPMAEKC